MLPWPFKLWGFEYYGTYFSDYLEPQVYDILAGIVAIAAWGFLAGALLRWFDRVRS